MNSCLCQNSGVTKYKTVASNIRKFRDSFTCEFVCNAVVVAFVQCNKKNQLLDSSPLDNCWFLMCSKTTNEVNSAHNTSILQKYKLGKSLYNGKGMVGWYRLCCGKSTVEVAVASLKNISPDMVSINYRVLWVSLLSNCTFL